MTLSAASARAIAECASLSLTEDANAQALGVVRPLQPLRGKHAVIRGFSDILAHVERHHCHALHTELRPHSPLASRLFNDFERGRCEALGSERFLGSATNLSALWAHQNKQRQAVFQSVTEREIATVVSLVREALGLDGMQTRAETAPSCGQQHHHILQELRHALDNQRQFAELSLQLIEACNFSSAHLKSGTDTHSTAQNESTSQDTETQIEAPPQADADDTLSVTLREEQQRSSAEPTQTDSPPNDSTDVTTNRDTPVSTESDGSGVEIPVAGVSYSIYSRNEDEIIHAANLSTGEEMVVLREQLDQHIQRHARIIGKLSGKLQRVLMAHQTRHWQFNLNEGLLDTARLTRVVTDPLTPLSFKQESDSPFRDTSITLLVDNSRSMLGKPIAIAAACADLLTQTLERCGVSVEILGYTTTELHRGALHERWLDTGARPQPGRLNGLRHIIYKPFETPYRRARMNFGVMLRKDLLKQNIDGESLLWAYNRLMQRSEIRKVLIVISDGAPIDTSTLAANHENYLIDHLQQVISRIENAGQIELLAIGIGHDVTRYYQRAMKIMDVRDLSQSLLAHISELFKLPYNS